MLDRFISKVSPEALTGCWLWTAALDGRGYGVFFDGRRSAAGNKIPAKAHRVSYQLHKGEIPAGQRVLHTCDNPACVAPHHLFLGSAKDNTQDMLRKGRANGRPDLASRDHCAKGHPFSGDNLAIVNGTRRCRACRVIATRNYHQKAKA